MRSAVLLTGVAAIALKNLLMKRWQFWVGVAISIVFLWLALRGLHLRDVWTALRGAHYAWLLPGLAIYFLGVWVRAWRWQVLLAPVQRLPLRRVLAVITLGYMGNNLLPARAGELLRAYALRRQDGVPLGASLATIVVERIFDGVVMLAFVFFNLGELTRLSNDGGLSASIRATAVWGGLAFLGVLGVIVAAALRPESTARILTWLVDHGLPARLRAPVHGAMHRSLAGLATLRSPGMAATVLLTSAVVWLCETGKYWFVMHAFPFQVSFFSLMLMNGVVNLATTLPAAPGYIGTFDLPGIAVLEAYGVEPTIAAAYTLVLHAALWLPITALGLWLMLREGLSWSRVRVELSEVRP